MDWSGSAKQRRSDPGGCPAPADTFAFVIPKGIRALLKAPGETEWSLYTTRHETTEAKPAQVSGDNLVFELHGWSLMVRRNLLVIRQVQHVTRPRCQEVNP